MNNAICEPAAVARVCAASDPNRGAQGLLTGLGRLWPDLSFKKVMTRGGWYRTGGVVDIDRQRVADSLRDWAEHLANGDLRRLMDHCLQNRLFTTRMAGQTHYFTARTGSASIDFTQLEIEELQEVTERYLSDPDWLPDNLEEFIDPLDYPLLEPEPVGAARFVFRRFFTGREMINPVEGTASRGLLRFMQDWDSSSAATCGHFCEHWVLDIGETNDGEDEETINAHPLSACRFEQPPPGLCGAQLANWIHNFDRAAGYPMAWFFHMTASAGIAHSVAIQVAEDHMQDYSYLPAGDLDILQGWMASPYRA